MEAILPRLLAAATLLPLVSFFVILLAGNKLKSHAATVATIAIGGAGLLSFVGLFVYWLADDGVWKQLETANQPSHHGAADHETADPATPHGSEDSDHDHGQAGDHSHDEDSDHDHGPAGDHSPDDHPDPLHAGIEGEHSHNDGSHHPTSHASHGSPPRHITGEYYTLGKFGRLRLNISYYIDTLTMCMFCMVTLIATLIHIYAIGYMHDEESEYTDHEVTLADGSHLVRPGRYHRFFQFLSLFCFSMLGLVLAGNIAMVFVFWELVGICSYFLIGFYVERKSASTAGNKAFIVNRVGDFGMIIGLMILWTGCSTFAFGDIDSNHDGKITNNSQLVEQGLFSQVRPQENGYQLQTPDGLVAYSAQEELRQAVREANVAGDEEATRALLAHKITELRNPGPDAHGQPRYGYWLLIVAGLGIFCGCVGKSAQFPLHVWLPDAMEGPTPVSALVHSATMVAAGVYLVGRFYPVFPPEVLLVIAIIGCITLFMAATIAITATDIKRVLAYSTVSQLGYMMMALGVGGWLAGMMHLITHAFFKSLLFMCSGSVIHAVHTNEMPLMGGLWRKIPYTAFTMLIGCLAIAGASIPFLIGLSGYYSKDAILEQAYSFMQTNSGNPVSIMFWIAAGGAAMTAFYMFRLWFLTFAGKPRDEHRYEHAHESKMMYAPLLVLAVFAIAVAWTPISAVAPWNNLNLAALLESARPVGTGGDQEALTIALTWPDEHASHVSSIKVPVTLLAFATGILGMLLAAVFYWWKFLDPKETGESFGPIHRFLLNKWWFDELYDWLFVKPTHAISRFIAGIDRIVLDGIVHAIVRGTKMVSLIWDRILDRFLIDGLANGMARWTHGVGVSLRAVQTGQLRQYVMFIALGTVTLFLLISFF
ncbi:MAG TPA: NADH-quinone oxidoreductase subunit L [Planctomycetaceae bacterium]|nr:NADH-quinone oxidoreductase subunit L [Planctomycetaceae bacterium]